MSLAKALLYKTAKDLATGKYVEIRLSSYIDGVAIFDIRFSSNDSWGLFDTKRRDCDLTEYCL